MSDEGAAAVGSELLDPERFRSFYDRALPVVYGYFFKRCGGREDVAADLTQETVTSAVRSLRAGTAVASPLPWIVSIARRRLVDFYRRGSSREVVADWPDDVLWVGSPWTSAWEARLAAGLDRLPEHYRLVLVLRFVDDLSVAEVAELIGRSVRATESLLVRARAALSKAYEEADRG